MKNIFQLVFFVFVTGNALCQTAPTRLKYYGFYLVNTGIDDPNDGVVKTNYTDEVGSFTNLNQAAVYFPTQNISADVDNMNAACTLPFLSIEQVFWRRVDGNAPSGNNYDLYPDWQARWNTFKATNAASLTAQKIGCFYIADEPLWNGIPFEELNAVTQAIKNDYPDIPTFYIEAFNQLGTMRIPTSVDWVAFDQYGIFDPATNAAYLGRLATLKSKRSNNQKIFIISDTRWDPIYAAQNITPADMGATIQSYYDLAVSDPDVVGLIGYLWPGGFDGPGSLGARNLPQAVKDKLASHGHLIKANYSPCAVTPASTLPTVPTGLVASLITKTSFTLSWTASTDDVAVTGYEVFVNGQYYGATTSTSLSITGLACATAYSMTVNAFDNPSPPHGVSAQSAIQTVTTAACAATPAPTLPTVPTNLVASSVKRTSFTLSWTASTGSVAVTGYEVFRNGQYYGATTGTSLNVTGLACATAYSMTVNAFNNPSPPHGVSAQSTARIVTTSACKNASLTSRPAAGDASLSAYPNPSPDGRPTLRLTALTAQTATVLVTDALGQPRARLEQSVPAGPTDLVLPQKLPPGLYYLQTTLDGQVLHTALRIE